MSEDVTSLNEIVVLGYTTTSKTKLVSSAVQLDSKSLSQTPYVSADQALQGKVAGLVMVTPSGTPGSGMQIRIRGVSSITAGNSPLFVIDGVPVNSGDAQYSTSSSTLNPLASIDPENIESITVLKDASSTALYGARGANGVIVVKTKRGKQGKTQFNFTTSYGLNNDATTGPAMLTADQRAELFYEAIYNTYGARNGFTKDKAKQYYQNNLAALGTQYDRWEKAGRPNTDWGDVITHKNAKFKQFDLSASGGGGGLNFFTSLGYTKQEATVIGSDFERISGQVNMDKDFSKRLRFSTQNSASYMQQNGTLEQSAYFSSPRAVKFFMPPTVTPYNPDGSINLETDANPNPIYVAANNINQSKFVRTLSNNSLTYDLPVKNLRFTTRTALDWQSLHYKYFVNRNHGDGLARGGINTTAVTNNLTYVIQNYFDYEATVYQNHSFTFKALQEFQRNNFYNLVAGGNSFPADGLSNLANAGTPTTAFSSNANWSLASYSGLMEYAAFENRYVVNASIRKEGNSRFSSENRWGTFWSAGLAWNVHKESFLKNVSPISNLKLRTSYGKTGNAGISLNQYQSLLDFTAAYGGQGASIPGTYGNKKLSWETSFPFEAGADVGLFDERITGRFSYFYRETRDLLQDVPLTRSSGFGSQLQNTGSMSNQGIEIEANFELIRKKDFHISLGGNLATATNKVLTLGKSPKGTTLTIQSSTQKTDIGHPVSEWFLPNWAGVDSQTGVDTWYVKEGASDVTKTFSQAAQVWQGGSAIPTLTAGMNLHADYKGIFFDANGYYSGGNKVFEDWARYTLASNLQALSLGNGTQQLMDRWQKPGDAARFPKMEHNSGPGFQNSSKFLYLGDFFRIKSATLGYNISPGILKKLAVTSVQIFIRSTNFFTWVKDSRLTYDPETALQGFTSLTTPPYKSIMTGLTIKF
ncbi:MAG: SusC/RagA family TonB-linked outer membrane protein [Candidatus Nephrothrix sp. EaCA]|nr:MAG: SusC/RagA family TonB-linked outer membrane protein [Candidatus Nephrothrix sp. EaCA]